MVRQLDHLVLAARDLDAAAAFYRRLGFVVGPRNRHPWGTLNHIVQFPQHFLELLGAEAGFVPPPAGAPEHHFAGFLGHYLAAREGLAMVVLASTDAAADHADFAAKGIGIGDIFRFERKGRRPDGSEVHVAFSLAFAADAAFPATGFFVCQQHFPEAFWNAAVQDHPNTALGVNGVTFAAAEPGRHIEFMGRFAGRSDGIKIPTGYQYPLGRGNLEIMTPHGIRQIFGGATLPRDPGEPTIAAQRFMVREMAAVRAILRVGEVPFAEHRKFIVIPPEAAFGVAIVFEPAA